MELRKPLKNMTLGAALLIGVSNFSFHELQKINTKEFADSIVVLKNKKIPIQTFYENLTYRHNQWIYTDEDRKRIGIEAYADFNSVNKSHYNLWHNYKRRVQIDTVKVYVHNNKWTQKETFLYKLGRRDSVPNKPSLGISGGQVEHIRHFVRVDGKQDARLDIYNDEFNCTHAHEDQHYQNSKNGIGQIGQSYELTFAETCLDEISANIRQLKAQRANYLSHGRDIRYITPRFEFYKEALQQGKINPLSPDEMTKSEKEFIANGVFDSWMKDKFDMYAKNNMKRTLTIHSSTHSNYSSVQEDTLRHNRIMSKCFKIDGIDFYSYIKKREDEILERITPEQKEIFARKTAEKKAAETHLDKLERLRISEGKDACDAQIKRRIRLVKLNKFLGIGR